MASTQAGTEINTRNEMNKYEETRFSFSGVVALVGKSKVETSSAVFVPIENFRSRNVMHEVCGMRQTIFGEVFSRFCL